MEFSIGMDVLFCANEQKNEEMLFNRWIHSFSDISFDDFKNKIGYRRPQNDDEEPEDILGKVKKIMGG